MDLANIDREDCCVFKTSESCNTSDEKLGNMKRLLKKSDSMPISRVGTVVGPDDDFVMTRRSVNLLSVKHPSLAASPPPRKFVKHSQSEADLKIGRPESFSENTARVSRQVEFLFDCIMAPLAAVTSREQESDCSLLAKWTALSHVPSETIDVADDIHDNMQGSPAQIANPLEPCFSPTRG